MDFLNQFFKNISLSILDLFLFLLLGIAVSNAFPLVSQTNPYLRLNLNSFPDNIFFILLWILIFLLIKNVLSFSLKFLLSFKTYKFDGEDFPKKWEYQGNIRLDADKKSLIVTDSNSGCILKNHYWKNLEISFKCIFPEVDDATLGIIFRARSLSNYLMIQVNGKENYINPHIRIEGKWETARQGTYPISNPILRNNSYRIKLRAVNQNVELFINNEKQIDWDIPTNSDISSVKIAEKDLESAFVPKIDFRNKYGKIGFRAYQGERAIISNLIVKRIANII